MFGWRDLKPYLPVAESTVECPVLGCTTSVARQRSRFQQHPEFRCPQHRIYISPSTFEYQDEAQNLIWDTAADSELLRRLKRVKRECRMARERSEDALVWNVFRHVEESGALPMLLERCGCAVSAPVEPVWWSYSPSQDGAWSELLDARVEFGEAANRGVAIRAGSEPDLILISGDTLLFLEAKFTSSNSTPSKKEEAQRKAQTPKRYVSGGASWFETVFSGDYATVVTAQKYELLRLWLIGTWIAQRLHLAFRLVALVRRGADPHVESEFGQFIRQSDRRRFVRWTWEQVYSHLDTPSPDGNRQRLLDYLRNKTAGYDGHRCLTRAFSI